MANISAADIKKLREATGAGMSDCKSALVEADGDYDKAMEQLRVKGLKGVAKRESRSASNGLVTAHIDTDGSGVLLELNCETDFVAKGEKFQQVAQHVVERLVASRPDDVEAALNAEAGDGRTLKEFLDEANATLGEKIELRRFASFGSAYVASYLHKTSPDLPPQVGVLVELTGPTEIGRDIAQHIAAFAPTYVRRDDVPDDVVAKEREIAEATAREEGKPEAALPKIVEGRVTGFFKEAALLEQAYAKDSKKTVQQVLAEAGGVSIARFARFRVGQA